MNLRKNLDTTEIQAVDFFFCRNAQTHSGVEDAENDVDGHEDIEGDDADAKLDSLVELLARDLDAE